MPPAGQLPGQHVGEKVVELVAVAHVFRIEQQGPAGAGEQDGGIPGGIPGQTEGERQQAFVPDLMRFEAGLGQGVGKAVFLLEARGQGHPGQPGPALGKGPGVVAQGLPPGTVPVQAALQGLGRVLVLGGDAAGAQKAQGPVPDGDLGQGLHMSSLWWHQGKRERRGLPHVGQGAGQASAPPHE